VQQQADLNSQVRQQAAINAAVVTLAGARTAGLWPQVDWGNPAAVGAVRTLFGGIVDQFGQSAAAVSAQFYDEQRIAADVGGQYAASMAPQLPPVMLDKIVTSAFLGGPEPAAHAPEPAPAATTSDLPVEERVPARLDGALQRLVLQPGRDTITLNAAKDPVRPRYIRIPAGPNPCAFCVLLASRQLNAKFSGYASAARAGGTDATKYHKHCECVAVPVFPGDDPADLSPNMSDYEDMYSKARADAGSGDTKAILASMRKLHGLR